MNTLLLTTLLLAASPSTNTDASASAKKAAKAKAKSNLDFKMDLPSVPKGDGLTRTKEDAPAADTRAVPTGGSHYAVVSLQHAQAFVPRGQGYEAKYPVSRVDVANLPTTLPPFHSLVIVKSPEKMGAGIEVRLLDPQGGQVTSSEGALVFGGNEEAAFLVDWDAITIRKAGNYAVEVKVAGQSLLKQPLPVVQELRAKLVATPTALKVDAGTAAEPPVEKWP